MAMATRTSAHAGGAAPIQIQARILRDWQSLDPPGAMCGFAIGPGQDASPPEGATRRRRGWREKDVERAIGAARDAGLTSYRVEIAPDGTISIIVEETGEADGV